jgi:hypothetical protein
MPEEIGGALYDEQAEAETCRACYVPVKSPENLPQFVGGNADTATAAPRRRQATHTRPPRGV